jgi:hypothetical protein
MQKRLTRYLPLVYYNRLRLHIAITQLPETEMRFKIKYMVLM